MSKAKLLLITAGAAVALATVYFAVPKQPKQVATSVAASPEISAEPVFAASFKDLDDKLQPLEQWRGKVVVLNFWAPWCPPCREEMPDFIKLQDKYRERGLVFIGVALDEKIKVQAFADEIGVNYPVLLGEMEAVDLAKKIGNRLGGLPFTVVIDRNGKIIASEVGGLTMAKLEKIALPLL
ncbi:thioredoxin [Sulfuricella denitrificans skB26]|uniref:Thioredoxin n=1 Tax=Sulfuricella denitrificans (strain DSM 22764 / NBRC 105220 / skB26) TaxID=1163617 RepID=S6B845_SULDS|nr:TlpA disulfide reductase family protein [Sulfuricella denitrificans]BAN36587.1 thioredoxin [Sulfuricella denitrificans skB26]